MAKKQKVIRCMEIIAAFIMIVLVVPEWIGAGSLTPPVGDPAPTMRTLDEVLPAWSQKIPTSERFELVLDGEAVLDKETGLVWAKNPDAVVQNNFMNWETALATCQKVCIGCRYGWRLPSVNEMASLLDKSLTNNLYLPLNHPFEDISVTHGYWSNVECVSDKTQVWLVYFGPDNNERIVPRPKTYSKKIWPVRGGIK